MKIRFSTLTTLVIAFICFNSCKNLDTTQTEDNSDLLVQVYEESAISALEVAYGEYELQKVKMVSRSMNIYLFTFNSKKIKQNELIQLLKNSDLVKEAQSNKNIQPRN